MDQGQWLREVVAIVGAPDGSLLLDHPHQYLADYLTHSALAAGRKAAPLPLDATLAGWQSRLWTEDAQLDYLIYERGLSEDTIREAGLGWISDQRALTIPVYDAHGELVSVVRRPQDPQPGRKYLVWPGRNQHNGGRSSTRSRCRRAGGYS